ncbi:hypothetical protein BDZ97DRAFT_1916839 [Flammula alnicola]|nr:hypothetical protein BDZ97DRAFT_1916839 [Flammula alnicola]
MHDLGLPLAIATPHGLLDAYPRPRYPQSGLIGLIQHDNMHHLARAPTAVEHLQLNAKGYICKGHYAGGGTPSPMTASTPIPRSPLSLLLLPPLLSLPPPFPLPRPPSLHPIPNHIPHPKYTYPSRLAPESSDLRRRTACSDLPHSAMPSSRTSSRAAPRYARRSTVTRLRQIYPYSARPRSSSGAWNSLSPLAPAPTPRTETAMWLWSADMLLKFYFIYPPAILLVLSASPYPASSHLLRYPRLNALLRF